LQKISSVRADILAKGGFFCFGILGYRTVKILDISSLQKFLYEIALLFLSI